MRTLYWIREDLRLFDNPALRAAAQQGTVLPVFIYPEGLGRASCWWLHHSLRALQSAFSKLECPLLLKRGEPVSMIADLAEQVSADQVVWNRVYSPKGIQQGRALRQALEVKNIVARSFAGQLLVEPTQVLTGQQSAYKVFTPFWRACREHLNPPEPDSVPSVRSLPHKLCSDLLDDWQLQPTHPDWSGGLAARWQPGEDGAQRRWQDFMAGVIEHYEQNRDFPGKEATSLLSPHLTFGEISVRQLWHEMRDAIAIGEVNAASGNKFLAELGWREFSRYLLVHFPHIIDQPFHPRFKNFPWQNDAKLISAWQRGQTGYPLVDAGMRELWHTGYMHNRVRMIAASFLTKHCLCSWQIGADWFWDTLVDADIASNTASWQWVAGCGADAAPYFRIFNPILQSKKFDAKGEYIRQWLPELAALPNKHLHQPWSAAQSILNDANVVLGETYPYPIVDHAEARATALQAYQSIR